LEFFKKCKERGVHTVLDTCGYVKWERLLNILEYTDIILYDIKHMNSKEHKRLTGVSNELILKNAENIAKLKDKKVIIRYPVIPGYNDSIENIDALGEFMNKIGLKEICLLPYHRLGSGKYEKIGRKYRLDHVLAPSESQLKGIKDIFDRRGFICSIQ
jgi:pyruvate formate lyase activating enzyme